MMRLACAAHCVRDSVGLALLPLPHTQELAGAAGASTRTDPGGAGGPSGGLAHHAVALVAEVAEELQEVRALAGQQLALTVGLPGLHIQQEPGDGCVTPWMRALTVEAEKSLASR